MSADLERGLELGGAGWRARMLATVPSNLKSPQWLAEQAEELAAEHGLACEIWDEQKLARERLRRRARPSARPRPRRRG